GLYGNFGQTNYGAAKLAVVGFINTLKLEGQKNNIHCNALAPVAYTRMTSDLMPPEAEQMLTPEAVTPGVMFLVSEQAPTGMILCAGAGVFAAARMEEAEGIFLGRDGLTAEKVAENWEKISDFSNASPFFMGGEQTGKFFKLATGGK
ncbi:MAG: 3-oxoacyl-ACP reductase, partial [Alphaproteobacteria bacterium HGW-Alphaproteobacteria-5]